MSDPRLAKESVLRGGGRADHVRARDPAELDRRHADSTRGRVHQYPVAGVDVAEVAEHQDGRQVVHRDRGPLRKGHLLGEGEDLESRHRDGLGVPAEARERDHTASRRELSVDPGAHALDRSRHLVADDARAPRRVGIEAEPRHHVGEVDARGADADEDLARSGLRVRTLTDLQDLGRPRAGDPDGSHGMHLRGRRVQTLFEELEMDHHGVQWVLDLVSHPRREAAERRQSLRVADEGLDGHVRTLREHGQPIGFELLSQALEFPGQFLELVVRDPRGRDLEFPACEPPDFPRQGAQGIEHQPGEGPGREPRQRQRHRRQCEALAQRRIDLATEERRAEPEPYAPERRPVEVHRQHDLIRLPGVR